MGTLAQQAFDRKSMPEYPFDIGYRWVKNGSVMTQIPLTEEDFLHPQEEDRFLLTKAHSLAVVYIQQAIERQHRGRPGVVVFFDHRIDWQQAEVQPMGPDVVVFGEFHDEWDPTTGTVPVAGVGAEPWLVVEVTSPSTRHTDLGVKPRLYHRVGVPYYLIVDLAVPDREQPRLLAYRNTRRGYVEMKQNDECGVWIPNVELWFKLDGDRVVCHDSNKARILEDAELLDRLEEVSLQAASEKQRAEAEKQRADSLEKEIAELRAKLAQQPTKKNGHK